MAEEGQDRAGRGRPTGRTEAAPRQLGIVIDDDEDGDRAPLGDEGIRGRGADVGA